MTDIESDHDLLDKLVDRLQSSNEGEGLTLEFKTAAGGLPKDVWPTVSAFANTNGGWLVLGVNQNTQTTTQVQGVNDHARILLEFNNHLRNAQKISHPVCGAADTEVADVNGRKLVLIRVPASGRRNRPVYVNGNPYTGTYVRRGEGDYLCQKPEVDRMMREASDATADSAVLANFKIDDLDSSALQRYRRRFQTQNPASPYNGMEDEGFLHGIGAYRTNRDTGQEGVTVAGLLLLGREAALHEWRTRHLIDFRVVSDDSLAEDRWADRVTCEGNLFDAFETLSPRLTAGLPSPFRLEGTTRVEGGSVHVAVREALVNLLVHADYAEPQASLIIQSQQGFTFRNPGSSRVPESDLFAGTHSDPRNPVLIRMFRLVGFAEEAGTGIPSIIKAWRELGFSLPAINTGTERYEFTLALRFAHLLSEDNRRWLERLGFGWTEAEQLALVLAREHGQVDNLGLRRLTGQHAADAGKTLVGLRDRLFLDMHGDRRTAHYVLSGTSLLAELPVSTAELSDEFEGDLDQFDESLDQFDESLDQGAEETLVARQSSRTRILADFSDELAEAASKMRREPYMAKAESQDIIVKLCTILPLTVQELSSYTHRSPQTLRKLLRELLRAGKLEYVFPESPTHPYQRYEVRE